MNYYADLVGMMTDCQIIIELLKREVPEIVDHLEKFNFFIHLNNILYVCHLIIELYHYQDLCHQNNMFS